MYSDFKANFDQLLEKDGSLSIHYRNIQTLANAVFKVLNDISPPIMNEVSQVKPSAPYSLRHRNELSIKSSKMVTYGTESVSFLTSKILSIVYQENFKSLDSFKKGISKWETICPCRSCKTYLQHVGFI